MVLCSAYPNTEGTKKSNKGHFCEKVYMGICMDSYFINPYCYVKMVSLVLCWDSIMITINDDFAGGVRCDNWVGSLFGEGGRVEHAIPPFFTLLGHNIDH